MSTTHPHSQSSSMHTFAHHGMQLELQFLSGWGEKATAMPVQTMAPGKTTLNSVLLMRPGFEEYLDRLLHNFHITQPWRRRSKRWCKKRQ